MKNIQQREEKLQRDFIPRKNKIMDMKNNIQQRNLSASQLRKVRYFSYSTNHTIILEYFKIKE